MRDDHVRSAVSRRESLRASRARAQPAREQYEPCVFGDADMTKKDRKEPLFHWCSQTLTPLCVSVSVSSEAAPACSSHVAAVREAGEMRHATEMEARHTSALAH